MLEYIDKLRRKPEPKRRKAVLLISVGVTLVIALIWGIFLFMKVSTMDFSFQDNSPEKNMPSLKQSVSTFIDQVGAAFSNTQNAMQNQSGAAAGVASTSDTGVTNTTETDLPAQ